MHGVLKLANKTNSKLHNSSGNEVDSHFAVLKAMFNLLSNLALCAECRGILWKVGEIQRRYQRTSPSLGPPSKEGELWERGCVSLGLKKKDAHMLIPAPGEGSSRYASALSYHPGSVSRGLLFQPG